MGDPMKIPLGGVTGGGSSVTIDRFPDECAICYRGITPIYVAGAFRQKPDQINHVDGSLQLVFQCPDTKCRAFFFGNYAGVLQAGPGMIDESWFFLRSIGPKIPRVAAQFPDEIKQLSNRFVRVYFEAATAQELKLTEVAGPGYRKALEILVKDFVISNHSQERPRIEKAKLAQCIDDYIDDKNVQECAKRAAWLGNDETHYVRVWDDKDLQDLKILIQLTMNWIHSTLLTKKYIEEMPPKRERA